MKFDHYEFRLGDWWASAIINGDESGLTDKESAELAAFITGTIPAARLARGHWDGFAEDDSLGFCRDEITGLGGDCYRARFYFPTDEEPA